MKKNLFRGKRKDNGEWIVGYYVCLNEKSHRIYTGYAETDCGIYYPDYCEVIPETVGRYIGLNDKNCREICEGDIVHAVYKSGYIAWNNIIQNLFYRRLKFERYFYSLFMNISRNKLCTMERQ